MNLKPILNEVVLHSLNSFLLAAMIVQFALIGCQAILMSIFQIPFDWSPFYLKNVSNNMSLWGFEKLFIVYGGIPLIFMVLGLLIYFQLSRTQNISWRARVFLSWITFFLVNTLITGTLASLFAFDGVGVVIVWMFPGFYLRLIIGLMAAMILIFSKPFWNQFFLKSAHSQAILQEAGAYKTFKKQVFKWPWLISTPFLLLFAILSHKWYWPLTLIYLGLIVFGFNWYKPLPLRIRILKINAPEFSISRNIFFFSALLIILFSSIFI